ncbi:MAG: site-specific integrase [Rhodospirillales bacterium]|nr:site-specific integrase [Rhodospirillales bacterium]
MATLRKRCGRWQAIIRRMGHPPMSRTFEKKADARNWARQRDLEFENGDLPRDYRQLDEMLVGNLLIRYRDEVVSRKKCKPVETLVVNAMIRQPFSKVSLAAVTAAHFAEYRDKRSHSVSGTTIRRELSILQHAFDIARREWAIPLRTNPLKDVRKPSPNRARTRRLQSDEFDRLIGACAECRNALIEPFIRFAVETAMRRGEITRLRWEDINLERRILHIPETKNGDPRTIPLTKAAVATLRSLQTRENELAFPISDNALKCAWRRVQKRSGATDLHFHDLRHEAVSRFFEMGLSVPEVALISGHRDFRMLARYTHLRAEDVVAKLR